MPALFRLLVDYFRGFEDDTALSELDILLFLLLYVHASVVEVVFRSYEVHNLILRRRSWLTIAAGCGLGRRVSVGWLPYIGVSGDVLDIFGREIKKDKRTVSDAQSRM